MTRSGAKGRATLEIEGMAWHAFEAWTAPSGLGLVYFVRADGEAGDRRAALEAGRHVTELSAEELVALWEGASALTSTERRVKDGDGEIWLVQGVGPVWAEGGSASDAIGVRARCLSADRPRLERSGVGPDELSDEEIRLWVGSGTESED